MSEVKPSFPISEEDASPAAYLTFQDVKRLSSRVWHQDELLNQKRRWLMGLYAISTSDGSKKRFKRPKFLTDDDPAYINHDEDIQIHGKLVEEILFDKYIDGNVIDFYSIHLHQRGIIEKKISIYFRTAAWQGASLDNPSLIEHFIRKKLRLWDDNIQYMFFPICHSITPGKSGDHWTVLSFNAQTHEWTFYNSLLPPKGSVARIKGKYMTDAQLMKEKILRVMEEEIKSGNIKIKGTLQKKQYIHVSQCTQQTNGSLTESYVRSDEVSYENVRTNVEKSFGAFSGSQRRHHVVQDYLQFFETFNMASYSINPSYFLGNLYSMMNALNNNALYLVANLVTDKKVKFEKTRLRMKKIIKDHLPNILGESSKDCPTPMKELAQIFEDPSNFQKKQLTLLTPVSPSLLSSIHKALEELDEMPFQDLAAMNRKLRDITVVPQFPPAKLAGKRDLLIERVKNKCQKVLSNLEEGADLPKPFAKALSIVQLSLKQKTRCMGIMASEFYPFSPETVGLQNDMLGALWSLPKVRINELKALQPLVDPEDKVPRKAFRIALRKYLMEYLFVCDVVAIPDEVSSILGSLNRSRRRPQLFSAGIMDEDIEAALNISSHFKQIVSNLFPDDKIDENSEDLGSDSDSDGKSNDFDLAEDSYYFDPEDREQRSCSNDEAEGAGDSSFTSWTPMPTYQRHSLHLSDSHMIGDVANKQTILEQDDSVHIITDESHSLHLTEACVASDFIKKLPQLEQNNCINSSVHYPEQASSQSIKKSNVEGDDQNPPQNFPEKASMTCDLVTKSKLDPGDQIKPSQHCPEDKLETTDMRETLIQELCDETSLVAYRLIGQMLDKFLSIEGRDANEMTRYYLRGGSSLDSPVAGDLNTSKEETRTNVLIQSVQELLPNMPKSSLERVKKLAG